MIRILSYVKNHELLRLPDNLLHYTNTKTVFEHILPTNSLRFNYLNQTNDPLEYKSCWLIPRFPENSNETFENALIFENQYKEDIQSLCFCRNDVKNDFGCLKPRMWSQYGDSHSGICLILSKSKLLKWINNHSDQNRFIAKNITYKTINLLDKKYKLDLRNRKNIHEEYFVWQNMNKISFIKHPDYKDEKEFRVLYFNPDKPLLTIPLDKVLKGFVLGDRFNLGYKPILKKYPWETYKSIKLYLSHSGIEFYEI